MEKKKIVKLSILAIISIIIVCFVITPITFQNDTYYTIKIGELIVKNGIDMQDHFSWHENLPYTYPHWAYDLATYLVYNMSGFMGVYIITAVLAIILGITTYLASAKITKNNVLSFIITIFIMYFLKDFIAARAQLVTFILFISTILCIEKFLENGKKIYAVFLIIIPIVIANVHCAVWPFYFILYLPYLAEYIVAIIKNRFVKSEKEPYKIIVEKKENVKWLFIIFLVTMFTGLLTPIGFTPYTYLVKTMMGNTTKNISEHLPIVLINSKTILIITSLVLGILTFTRTKIKLSDLFMLLGLILLTLMSKRQMSMLLLIGTPIFVKILDDLFKSADNKYEEHLLMGITTKLGIIITIIIVLSCSFKIYKNKKDDSYVSISKYPIEASEFILNNLDVNQIRLFNEYNYGSYLLFKGIPVFIDSRADLYAPEFNITTDENGNVIKRDIFSDFINLSSISTDYNSKFEYYHITHVILGRNSKLNMLISKDNKYNCIYSDNYFVIYEKMNAVKQ